MPLPPASPADATSNGLEAEPSAPRLTLWDAACLVVGIVVGTAIFRSSPQVFQNVAGPWQGLGAWALGGALSLVGALCYAELATTYPRTGGDYEYLTRAYGPWAGFLFGWAQLTAVFTGSVGTMAYAFGDYGTRLFGLPASAAVWLAAGAIVVMSALNAGGLGWGKRLQNLLTVAKVVGLTGVVLAGAFCLFAKRAPSSPIPAASAMQSESAAQRPAEASLTETESTISFGLAMVLVLYAYGGWSDAAFVAAEVCDRKRNLPRALIGGVAAITCIYLAVNGAYLAALGFDDARRTLTPAADVLDAAAGPTGARAVSALVMLSALGAINGMVLAGARVFAVLGADHRALAWLGGWDRREGAPRPAMAVQAAVTLMMVFGVGTETGRSMIDGALRATGGAAVEWDRFGGGFEALLAATAPVFWTLFLATGAAVFVLRWRNPGRERPFSAPLFPLTPALFCATCLYMLRSSLQYAGWLALPGAAPVILGLALYVATRKR